MPCFQPLQKHTESSVVFTVREWSVALVVQWYGLLYMCPPPLRPCCRPRQPRRPCPPSPPYCCSCPLPRPLAVWCLMNFVARALSLCSFAWLRTSLTNSFVPVDMTSIASRLYREVSSGPGVEERGAGRTY